MEFYLNNKERLIIFTLILYFLINYYIALTLFLNGVFFQNDLIFDTDPFTNLKSLSHGIQEGRFAFSHAFLELLSMPIYGIQYLITKFYPNTDARYIREVLAIGYSPIFGTLNLFVFYKIIEKFNINNSKKVLFLLIYGFSFSAIIFSSMPETFIISGFLINFSLYYLMNIREGDDSYFCWFILGVLLAGVTITNICIFFIIYFYSRVIKKVCFLKAVLESIFMSLIVVLIVLLYYKLVMLWCVPETPLAHEGKLEWISRFLVTSYSHAFSNIANVVSAVFNAFFSFPLNVKITNNCAEVYCNSFSFIRTSNDIYIIVTSLFFILYLFFFSYRYFINNNKITIYLSLISILGFNFILHTVFGNEMFLYSQHWFVATALLFLLPLNNLFILISIFITQIFLAGLYLFRMQEIFHLTWPLFN